MVPVVTKDILEKNKRESGRSCNYKNEVAIAQNEFVIAQNKVAIAQNKVAIAQNEVAIAKTKL